MFIDVNGKPVPKEALHYYKTKSGLCNISVRWYKMPKKRLSFASINAKLDELENKFGQASVCSRGRTITELNAIFQKKWFYSYESVKNNNNIEFCGAMEIGDDVMLFRYGNTDHSLIETEITGFEAWQRLNNLLGKETYLEDVFGYLPVEWHKYRDCCPCAVDYALDDKRGKLLKNINKADISSAYGYELTKELPKSHNMKIMPGRVEPNEEYPFAFYVKSNNMAVWNEGSTFDWKDNPYAIKARKLCNYDLPAEEDQTVLMRGVKDPQVEKVVKFLYNNRKENPVNKDIINFTIGRFSPRKIRYKKVDDERVLATPIMWHIRAVIMFRCNQRILGYCNELLKKHCLPMLINTDSISWQGSAMVDDITPPDRKQLGSFLLEHTNMEMIIAGIKCYQYKDGNEVITKYSGMPKSKSAEMPFGSLLGVVSDGIFENLCYYDKTKRRYCYFDTEEIIKEEATENAE